jgi:hypothetical protein
MHLTIRAHYNGEFIVPDEPVSLPFDQPLEVELRLIATGTAEDTIEEQLKRLARATGRIEGPSIPLDALRRKNLYEDRL